jgi:putative ABC transport system permease protein
MLNYHFRLAVAGIRRNPVLTLLIVAAVSFGVAMTMTAVTVLYVMAGDPIPGRSGQLFAVQIDSGGPPSRKAGDPEPATQLTYRDALALLDARAARRQVAMYETSMTVAPANPSLMPFSIFVRVTSPDFFAMFDVPMLYGHSWSQSNAAQTGPIVVLGKKLNERLFGGTDSVGKSVALNGASYQVIAVTDDWDPKPRFYDVIGGQNFEEGDDAYLPLALSIGRGLSTAEYVTCPPGQPPGDTFADMLRSECVWLQFWVQLPHQAEVAGYRRFLNNYSRDQQRSGRFAWPANPRLRNVRDWLVAQKVVPDDARLSVIVASGFFAVCLVSALGLMLAKALGRSAEFGIRRALGASGRDLFSQVVVESGIVGLLGGVCGVTLTLLCLRALRTLFPGGMGRIAQMDESLLAATIALALLATIVVGFYPAWRSMRVAPALQMKGG